MLHLSGNVQLSPLYLCTFVCLLITPFQFFWECFYYWFCRLKSIFLALCRDPWIWIGCPLKIHWQKIFFLISMVINSWKSLEAWISCPAFFCYYRQNVIKPKKKLRMVFFPPTISCSSHFCHTSLRALDLFFCFLVVYFPLFIPYISYIN